MIRGDIRRYYWERMQNTSWPILRDNVQTV